MGRRKVLGAALALAALVAASAAFPHGSELRPLHLAGPTKEPGPLLAFVQHHGAQWLAPVDGATLRLTGRPAVRLGFTGAWSYSPDGAALVVAARVYDNGTDSLRFVDVRRLRAAGRAVPIDGNARYVAWTAPDRIIVLASRCCGDESILLRIDPVARRVVSRERLEASVLQAVRAGDSLGLLLGPADHIGPARLLLVDGAASRTVPLDVTAGATWDESTNPPLGTQRIPALAFDPDRQRVYVVTPEGRVADVDVRTLGVAYHDLARSSSLVGRLGAWLMPAAAAKGMDGPERSAQWLGDGQLAISGADWGARINSNGAEQVSQRPAGLEIVDTTDWSVHVLDDGASAFLVTDGLLLATGATWSMQGEQRLSEGIGLTAYGRDGARRFQVFGGREVWLMQAYAGRAYVGMPNVQRLRVIDLGSGEVAGQRGSQLPWLLVGDSSRY